MLDGDEVTFLRLQDRRLPYIVFEIPTAPAKGRIFRPFQAW